MRTKKGVLRGLLVFGASITMALFLGGSPANADNGPHMSGAITTATTGVTLPQMGADRCASCHRAHTAKSAYLLAAASQEDLCFTCHGDAGTGSVLNVQSGVQYSAPDGTKSSVGALRGGGFDNAMIGSSTATKDIVFNAARNSYGSANQVIPALTAPVAVTSNHLGGPNTMWGNGAYSATPNPGKVTDATTKLECGSCHDPHGNGMYRILKPVPVGSGVTTGVSIKDTANKVYTTTNYWIGGDPNATDTKTTTVLGATSATDPTPVAKTVTIAVSSYQANVSAWCTTCHTRYLAASGSYNANTGDAIFTYRHRSDSTSKGEMGSPNCTQCHVAHGSNAVMSTASAVEYPGQTAVSTDSRLLRVDERGVCVMCHNV